MPDTKKYVPRHWKTGLVSRGVSLTSWGDAFLALTSHPSSNGITKEIPCGVMLYYNDQRCTSSFTIGFLKTKSNFIVRSVETGLGRWTMGVAVNSVDACLFWLSQTIAVTLRIQEVFSGCTVPLDSKDIKFGNSQQEVSPSACENTRKVL